MRKNRIQCKCLQCGILFEEIPSRIKLGRGKYHNRECANKSLIGKGIPDGNKFKKGQKPWNKDKPYLAIRGANHYRFKGGYWIDEKGYKMIEIKRLGKRFRMPEHRLIMTAFLNRELTIDEDVHHINGNKLDNRIENLLVLSKRDHTLLHWKLKREGGLIVGLS